MNNGNGYNNNPFANEDDYLFRTVNPNGRRKTYGWSVASLVCGIISVICCSLGYGSIILGVLAIVFSVISRKNLGYFDSMAIAGLVLGIMGFILGIAIIIAVNMVDEEFLEQYRQYLEEYLNEMEGTSGPSDKPDL